MISEVLPFFTTVPDGSPNNVKVTVLSSTEIEVSWIEVDPVDQNGIIVQYEVTYSSGSELNKSIFIDGSLLMTNVSGLEEDTEYDISVKAYTSVGPGPSSVSIIERTAENGYYIDCLWQSIKPLLCSFCSSCEPTFECCSYCAVL